jgi:hypothetical protein
LNVVPWSAATNHLSLLLRQATVRLRHFVQSDSSENSPQTNQLPRLRLIWVCLVFKLFLETSALPSHSSPLDGALLGDPIQRVGRLSHASKESILDWLDELDLLQLVLIRKELSGFVSKKVRSRPGDRNGTLVTINA